MQSDISIRKYRLKSYFSTFIFLNQDFLFTIISPTLKLCNPIDNVHSERAVSHILNSGPTLCFMLKYGEHFVIFGGLNFLDFMK